MSAAVCVFFGNGQTAADIPGKMVPWRRLFQGCLQPFAYVHGNGQTVEDRSEINKKNGNPYESEAVWASSVRQAQIRTQKLETFCRFAQTLAHSTRVLKILKKILKKKFKTRTHKHDKF